MPIIMQAVNEAARYTLREAADLIPGRHGKAIHPVTLQNWLQTGRAKGEKHGGAWYVPGHEVMRLRGEKPEPATA